MCLCFESASMSNDSSKSRYIVGKENAKSFALKVGGAKTESSSNKTARASAKEILTNRESSPALYSDDTFEKPLKRSLLVLPEPFYSLHETKTSVKRSHENLEIQSSDHPDSSCSLRQTQTSVKYQSPEVSLKAYDPQESKAFDAKHRMLIKQLILLF